MKSLACTIHLGEASAVYAIAATLHNMMAFHTLFALRIAARSSDWVKTWLRKSSIYTLVHLLAT